jgi:uncharacterized protein (DUF4415 family)
MSKKPLIDEQGEMREVTVADLKKFRPATEMLPHAALALFADGPKRRGRGLGRKPAKVQVTVRLDPEIAAGLRQHPGWRQEASQVWREWLSRHGE